MLFTESTGSPQKLLLLLLLQLKGASVRVGLGGEQAYLILALGSTHCDCWPACPADNPLGCHLHVCTACFQLG